MNRERSKNPSWSVHPILITSLSSLFYFYRATLAEIARKAGMTPVNTIALRNRLIARLFPLNSNLSDAIKAVTTKTF